MFRKLAIAGGIAIAAVGFAATPALAAPPQALNTIVNEVTTIGGANYVELQAASKVNSQTGSLQGWSLRVYSPTGVQTASFTFTSQKLTKLGQHMLIAAPGANTAGVTPDVVFSGLDIDSAGGVALYNPAGVKQDGIAFSSNADLFAAAGEGANPATDFATAETSQPGVLRSVSRNNALPSSSDTNNNRVDFSVQNATPMNRSS